MKKTPNPEHETQNPSCLQEIVMICMACGNQKLTGRLTQMVDFDSKYAYSHGYCSVACAEKHYPGVTELFSQYDDEE